MSDNTFTFYSIKSLTEHSGFTATTLDDVVVALESVADACIFHHMHRSFLQHHFLASEFSNDFAHWVKDALQLDSLAEKLANIDTTEFTSIHDIRIVLIDIIKDYIKHNKKDLVKASKGKTFHFLSARSLVFPSNITCNDLPSFIKAVQKVSINSVFFHYFIAHLRLGRKTNDFSYWLSSSLGADDLANKIAKLNPQMYSLSELRKKIIGYCKEYS